MPAEDLAAARARQVRAELGLGEGPVPEIISTLERLGLAVYVRALGDDGPDGAYLPRPRIKVVLLNGDKYLARLRFTAAHELGHHSFSDGAQLDQDVTQIGTAIEQRANAFAASFLMPEGGILARTSGDIRPDDIVRLALEFGVSYESLVHRLQKLRRINSQQKAALLRDRAAVLTPEFRQRRLVVREQLPSDFLERALNAYDDTKVSFARLIELLRLEPDQIDEFRTRLRDAALLHEEDDPAVHLDVPPPAPPEPRTRARTRSARA
jgi:Zn-dependent peptidase ImmA (M78 family)